MILRYMKNFQIHAGIFDVPTSMINYMHVSHVISIYYVNTTEFSVKLKIFQMKFQYRVNNTVLDLIIKIKYIGRV